MNMKKINCAKCGKPELVSEEQAAKAVSLEEAQQKLLKGESATVHLCDGCVKLMEIFRKVFKN